MARIAEYTAPTVTLRPDEKGYAAFETAGRRIGPLYSQAAEDLTQAGKLTAQGIEDTGKTQMAIADLIRQPAATSTGAKGGVNFRVGKGSPIEGGSTGPDTRIRAAHDLAKKVDAITM